MKTISKSIGKSVGVRIGSKLNAFYVRPTSVEAYGTEDGKSYANAFNGFADIDWTAITPGAVLYVCGTHNEQLTIGTNGQAGKHIKIVGNYTPDPAILNIEGTAETYCIFVNAKNYVTVKNFSSLIGSGTGACVRIEGASGSAGLGHTIVFDSVSVTRNYASTNGDGFSLDNTAEVKFYDISATDCRKTTSTSESHQALTLHNDSKAKVYGLTATDCTYGIANTQNSYCEVYNATITGSYKNAVTLWFSAILKIYDSTINVTRTGSQFGGPATSSTSQLYVNDSEININAQDIILTNYAFGGKMVMTGCDLTFNYPMQWRLQNANDYFELNSCSLTFTALMSSTGIVTKTGTGTGVVILIDKRDIVGTGDGKGARVHAALDPSTQSTKTIQRCVVKNMTAPFSLSAAADLNFYNNTFYNDVREGLSIAVTATNNTGNVKNNIFYNVENPVTFNYRWYVTLVSNDYYNSTDVGGTGSITDNPLLVNPGVDYQLQAASPCINAGADVGLTEDKNGNPVVGIPDIGAYEYQG